MKRPNLYAVSQDRYWLEAIAQLADTGLAVEPLECVGGYPDCLQELPEAEPEALLLLDATGQSDVAHLSRLLRARGWQHVVVVAADPCSEEARAVLKERAADDYWHKTYARKAIQRDVDQYIADVWGRDDE
jgi:DNA-binding response OmpR family regulator